VSNALYEPLIERDVGAIPAAARAFAEERSVDELFLALARFAVLAYAPSQHAKRAVMACRAAYELREAYGARWIDVLIECARYAAESRQPWSEPPLLEPPQPSSPDIEELRAAVDSGDRLRAERWLAARLDDCEDDIASLAGDDALLMLDTARALVPILGEKGRYALLRMPVWELTAGPQERTPREPLETLIDRAIASRGAVDAVHRVLVCSATASPPSSNATASPPAPPPYHLARDYAQTLLVHALASRVALPRTDEFLNAVKENLQSGESFAEWSFA
jgi:hypothetical protein